MCHTGVGQRPPGRTCWGGRGGPCRWRPRQQVCTRTASQPSPGGGCWCWGREAPLFSASQARAGGAAQASPEGGGQRAGGASPGGTSEAMAWRGPCGCPTLSAGRPQLRLEVWGGRVQLRVPRSPAKLTPSWPEEDITPPEGDVWPPQGQTDGHRDAPVATPSAEPGTVRSAVRLPGSLPGAAPACSPKRGMFQNDKAARGLEGRPAPAAPAAQSRREVPMGGDSPGVSVASRVGRGPALGCAPWGRGLGASRTDWGSRPSSPLGL